MRYLILDIATAPLADVDDYLDDPKPHGSLKDPVKIAADIAEKRAEARDKAGLHPDTCRISGMGIWDEKTGETTVHLCPTAEAEAKALTALARLLNPTDRPVLIGYNSLSFDWPICVRRALYAGIDLDINCDRYRSPHIDLFERLTYRGAVKGMKLSWYAKRCQWTDLQKTLSGEEESRIFSHQRWDDLEASIRHDLECTRRLARLLKVW